MTYDKPLPKPDEDRKPFWDGCRAHKLLFQKCKDCKHVRWPASILCPKCHSQHTDWIQSSGSGKVYTYVVYHQTFLPAFKKTLPYVVAVVALEEGPHILTNIVGCRHDQVKCDMPVTVCWEDVTEEYSLPKFRPINTWKNQRKMT